MRWLYLGWLYSFIILFVGYASNISAATQVELNEDDSMVVELRLGNYMLSDAMIVYQSNGNTLVSLQQFLDGLEFAITVDSDTQQASGWFINSKNTFSLNIKTNEVVIRGKKTLLEKDFPFSANEFDLFVDIEYIKRWFDIDINLQMARLIMQVTTKEPLPIEQRVMREKNRSKSTGTKSSTTVYPWVDDEYAMIGPPSLDFRMDAVASKGESQPLVGYSIQSTNDLLKHEARISITQTDQNSPVSARLAFSKQAPRPDETLGLGITNYQFGDIYARGDNLVSRGSPGVGFTVERYLTAALDQSFNRRVFEGDAPPGWEIELYRNGLFIDYQVVNESGHYVFKDVEVEYGENFFEITRYGPQGQVEKEKKRVQIGREMIAPKQWQFSTTMLNVNDQLVGEPVLPSARPNDGTQPQSIAVTALYGIFDQHSIGVGYNRSPATFKTAEKDFARLIWISAFPFFSSRLDYAQDLDGGQATSLNLTGRFLDQDINFENVSFTDFLSEQSNFGNTKQRSKITLFGNINAFRITQLPYSLGMNVTETAAGTRRINLENRLSMFFGRNRISNELNSSRSSDVTIAPSTRGALSFNRSSGSFQFRTILGYKLNPNSFTSASLTADYRRVNWRAQLSANLAKSDDLGKTYSLGLNFSRAFGNMAFGIATYSDFKDSSGIALSFDIGFSGHAHAPYVETARYGSSDMGALEAHVFMDANANGEFDDDEESLQGIRFKGRSSWDGRATDKDGIVVLNGMDTNIGSLVTMDTVTLNDPYLQPAKTSFRVASHAGAYRKYDVAVTAITEVEGYVNLTKGGSKKPVGGATVALYKNNELIAKTTTEFDGYYLFPRIAPGEYTATLIDENGGMKKYQWSTTPAFQTDIESGVTKVPEISVWETTNPKSSSSNESSDTKEQTKESETIKSDEKAEDGISEQHDEDKQKDLESQTKTNETESSSKSTDNSQ